MARCNRDGSRKLRLPDAPVMYRARVPDDMTEHHPEHRVEGLVLAIIHICTLLRIRSAPLAELLTVIHQYLNNHRQRLGARIGQRAPLIGFRFPHYMFGMGSKNRCDVYQMPSAGALDRRITHLIEWMHIECHRQRFPRSGDCRFKLFQNIEIS